VAHGSRGASATTVRLAAASGSPTPYCSRGWCWTTWTESVTLSEGEGQGERAPSRLIVSARSPGVCGRTLPHAQIGLIGAPANALSGRCQRSADRQKQRCAAARPCDCRLRPLGGELERHTGGAGGHDDLHAGEVLLVPGVGGCWPHGWNRPAVWCSPMSRASAGRILRAPGRPVDLDRYAL
jgi:hypothetical protein